MQAQNHIVSPYSAVIAGKTTGLAGCIKPGCTRDCLRKSEDLITVLDLRECDLIDCKYFIPTNED